MSLQILFRWFSVLYLNVMLGMYLVNGPDAQARIIRVSQSGDNTDGNSWATAFHSISAAVSQSSAGDSIWVCAGTYNDNVLIQVNLTILGGFFGFESHDEVNKRNPISNPTIIDATGKDKGVVSCLSNCVVDGFSLTGGSHAGLRILGGVSPEVSNCSIYGNESIAGGGGVIVSSSSPRMKSCYIHSNQTSTSGGGIIIEEYSTVNISNCTISNNVCYNGSGGGISCSLSTLIMENCVVTNNSAYTNSPEVTVSKGGGVVIGGGGSFGIFRNCLIANNWSTKWRQLVIGTSTETNVSLDNCTIIGDLAADAHWRNAPPTMTNCILWGANGILAGEEGEADISYSCIQGGYTGIGNISDDPLFRDPSVDDFRLQYNSPCIDTAATSGPSDDLNGNPRPVDIAGIGREATDVYDMGAYEFQEWELPVQTGVGNWNLYEARN